MPELAKRLPICVLLLALGCGGQGRAQIIVATTTSLQDSGLLETLAPAFEREHPAFRLRFVAVGTGEALELGARRDADAVLAHAEAAELTFVDAGHAESRQLVMRGEFLIVGPVDGRAGAPGVTGPGSAVAALSRVADAGAPFLSRGDDSGTHLKELELWDAAGLDREALRKAGWYLEAGQGMGEALTIAAERGAYLLTDKATWLAMGMGERLPVLVSGDPALDNPYSVLVVSGAANTAGARVFAGWLTGAEAQGLIARFGVDEFGAPVFRPAAGGER